MTLKSKNSRQVSLDFKKLPLNVANPIENRSLDTSFGQEDDSDDCKILHEEKNKSRKIENFFLPVPKSSNSLKRKKGDEGSAENPALKNSRLVAERMEVDEETENIGNKENTEIKKNDEYEEKQMAEVMEVSSSDSEDESEEEEESEDSETSESESETQSCCEPSGEKAAATESKPEPSGQGDINKVAEKPVQEKKKRRSSSVVEAERKEKELLRARRRVEKAAQQLERQREKERLQLEKAAKRARLAAERLAAKQLAEKEKEEKRLKREEAKREKELALKEKEEKKQKREEKKREKEIAKKEERQKKEDERKKREEERLQAEKDKKEREEAKRIEQEREAQEEQRRLSRQSAFFSSFFRKGPAAPPASESGEERTKATSQRLSGPFNQFQVKKDMQLAPISHLADEARCRKSQEMERTVLQSSPNPGADLYLTELRTGARVPICVRKKRERRSDDQDVVLIDPVASALNRQWHRVKLLQFTEDVRPPYYGTFRQRSLSVTGRRPCAKDPHLRNYEVDSEEEWEELEDGESLSHSDGDEEEVGEEGDDDNDGFFVPHGYLSEDEGVDGEEDDLTPEMRKAKQQLLEQRFEASMLRKLQPLQNVIISPAVDPAQHPLLKQFKVTELTNDFPIPISAAPVTPSASGTKAISKFGVPEEAMPDLIRLVSGNSLSMKKILFEFRMFWELKQTGSLPTVSWEEDLKGREWEAFSISKNKLERKIREFTKREDGCWRVSPELLALYPNEEKPWKYVTDVPSIRKKRKSSPVKEAAELEPETVAEKTEEVAAEETPSKVKRSSIMTFFANQEPGQQVKDTVAKSPLAVAKSQPSQDTTSKPGQHGKDALAKSPLVAAKTGPLTKFTAITSPFAARPAPPKVATTKANAAKMTDPKAKVVVSKATNAKVTDSTKAKAIPSKSPTAAKPGPKKKVPNKPAAVVKSGPKSKVKTAQPRPQNKEEKGNAEGRIPSNRDGISILNSALTKPKAEDRTMSIDVDVIDLCD